MVRFALFSIVAVISTSVHAGDLSAIKSCVTEGYSKLSNRNAIVAAVIDTDAFETMTFGNAKLNQIFEIGSVTKTFTANLLAQSIGAGSIQLSDPIPAAYQKPGVTITYQHLTTHTSGIVAGIFPGFTMTNPLSPFDGLTIPVFKSLYAQTPLDTAPGEAWNYSNMGVSLLGLILAENSGTPYEDLVRIKILGPLGMTDTYFQVPDSEASRFPTGYMIDTGGQRINIPHWDQYKTAIDPAGGLRSTITDMIKYARANLSPASSPLQAPIQLTQKQLYFIKKYNMWIGMNWIVQPDVGLIWHNGETYGFNSILAISTTRHQAVIAMTDTTVQKNASNGDVVFDTALQDVAFGCLK